MLLKRTIGLSASEGLCVSAINGKRARCVLAAALGFAALLLAACSEHSPADSSSPSKMQPTPNPGEAGPLPAEHYDTDAQIAQLKELRDRGLITEDEFQQKRKHLLERQ